MRYCLLVLTIILIGGFVYGQDKGDSLINNEVSFKLEGDTLYASNDLKLFSGKKLIVGNPSTSGGQYRSIVSNKAAIVPSIWGQDRRFENAIENYVDSKKNKERLRDLLKPGTVLTIDKISVSRTGRPHFYMVTLSSDKGICRADIKLALVLGELLLQP